MLSAIILISIDLDNLHESTKYSCSNVIHYKNPENKDTVNIVTKIIPTFEKLILYKVCPS